MIIKEFNQDGTRKTCPYGASLSFPVGKMRRVKVGDPLCHLCPCFNKDYYDKATFESGSIECTFADKSNNE